MRLLDEEHRRSESLQGRGGQLAGFAGAVFALLAGLVPSELESVPNGAAAVGVGLFALASGLLLAAVAVAVIRIVHPQGRAAIGPAEVLNYTTDRFMSAERWKVQSRTMRALQKSLAQTRAINIRKAEALRFAGVLFLAGLAVAVCAAATLALGFVA